MRFLCTAMLQKRSFLCCFTGKAAFPALVATEFALYYRKRVVQNSSTHEVKNFSLPEAE
jgi:hypothetical protein